MTQQPATIDEIAAARERLELVRREVMRVYVGSPRVIDLLLTTLLAQGHALLEGVPASPRRPW
jgi:MoxR-like ATPase